MCSLWGERVIEHKEKMKLEHLLHEVLTETTLAQPIMLSDPCSFSMLHPRGIDRNILLAILWSSIYYMII